MASDLLTAWLESAVEQRQLRSLDAAFALFLVEQDAFADMSTALLGALVSQQSGEGHVCLDLADLDEVLDDLKLPAPWRENLDDVSTLQAALATSSVVADPADDRATPLVVDGTRLYLRRYWAYERSIAQIIGNRLHAPLADVPGLGEGLQRLFPDSGEPVQWPRVACALAARGALTVITGGPGTGKTTAVVRLLGLLQTLQLATHDRPLRMRLAAPTGKAAARLNASIAAQIAALDIDDGVRASIPTEVVTLHRLLGARPDSRRFAYHAGNPLHLDVLVIDEASMIDLELMSAVLAALPPHARLILLGDKDQLSSVEAGAVLGDLCIRAEAGHYAQDTAAWLRDLTGDDISPWLRADASSLDQHVVMLRHSYRFATASGIGRLAGLVNAGDTDKALALLMQPPHDLSWQDTAEDALQRCVLDPQFGHAAYLRELIATRPSPRSQREDYARWATRVLDAFGHFQLLCAVRRGSFGTEAWNARIAKWLHEQDLIESEHGWYEGRPIIITHNDYALGLMNGDIGIALRVPDDTGALRLRVAFPSTNGMRFLPHTRLGAFEPAYALTVHKSQGSEFAHAALVLPDESAAVATRELVYTAITRAKARFSLFATADALRAAIERRTSRRSALAERLG
ncbi:MAG TPA: exodeoxyribonuclease V subunit alpha [Dyella sp.]|uniref:exodeoxyribonuclease V subunit alpha n=1 Tax=Dyella sp. TaxID=1869338 RepID=UPI002F93A079